MEIEIVLHLTDQISSEPHGIKTTLPPCKTLHSFPCCISLATCVCHVSSFHLPAISFLAESCSLLAGETVVWGNRRCSLGCHSDPLIFHHQISWTLLHCEQRCFMKRDSKGHLSYSSSLFIFPFQHNPFDIFCIPFGVLMCLFLLPHFIMFFSDLMHFFLLTPASVPCTLSYILNQSFGFQPRHQISEWREFYFLSCLLAYFLALEFRSLSASCLKQSPCNPTVIHERAHSIFCLYPLLMQASTKFCHCQAKGQSKTLYRGLSTS